MKKRTIMMIRKRRKRCKRNDGKSLVINYKKYDVFTVCVSINFMCHVISTIHHFFTPMS